MDLNKWAVTFLVFLVLESFGLFLGWVLISNVVVQPTNNASESVFFFAYLLVATAVMIGLIKFVPKALKIIELMAIFVGSEVFFEILMINVPNAGILASILAALIVYIRIVYPDSIWSLDLGAIPTLLGVGAVLGASLGVVPALLLLAILAIYDYISVFKTKHMVTLAKGVMKQNLAFMAAIPVGKRLFHIGGGDIIMPMMASIAILRANGVIAAITSLVGGLVGLMILIVYLSKHKGKVMPALPPITLGLLIAYGGYLILEALVCG